MLLDTLERPKCLEPAANRVRNCECALGHPRATRSTYGLSHLVSLFEVGLGLVVAVLAATVPSAVSAVHEGVDEEASDDQRDDHGVAADDRSAVVEEHHDEGDSDGDGEYQVQLRPGPPATALWPLAV